MTPERAALDIYLTYECSGHDHFSAQLYRLIAKSDSSHRRRLAMGFPVEVGAWEEWYHTPTAREFYKKYSVEENYQPDDTEKETRFRSDDDPIPEDLREVMNDIGILLDAGIRDHAERAMGFLLMVFDYGENGTLSYISNSQRGDVLDMLDEFQRRNRA